MAISVTNLGTNTFSAVTTVNITTTATSAAGGAILVVLSLAASSAWTCSDSGGNTYIALADNLYNTNRHLMMFYIANNALLASGGTITISWTTSAAGKCAACYLAGAATVSPVDVIGTKATGTATSSTVSTGTLAQSDELVVGIVSQTSDPGTWTEASGFTAINNPTAATGDNPRWAYQVVASTASVTYAPSWLTSRAYGTNVYSFKAAVATVSGSFSRAQQIDYLSI